MMGDFNEAKNHLLKAATLHSDLAGQLYFQYALCLSSIENSNYEEVLEAFDKATSIEPTLEVISARHDFLSRYGTRICRT
jgi:tetratricopeptide (TPR) repeat protein